MPFQPIKLSVPATADRMARVVEVLIDLTTQVLHKPAAHLAVCLGYVEPTRWFVGGKRLAEQSLTSFFPDIKITGSTNYKDENATCQRLVLARSGEVPGPLHRVSYVCGHAVRAGAYRYAGLTKEQRYRRIS